MTTRDDGNSALAIMIHNGHLASWLVQVTGRVIALLLVCTLVGAVIASFLETPELAAVGGAVGGLAVLVYLLSASAPFPSSEVTDLLSAED